jgi:hypothetical protein
MLKRVGAVEKVSFYKVVKGAVQREVRPRLRPRQGRLSAT